ncbi:phosphoketolase family protein [Nonomuraea gerenzanensis]|uniref:Xylulose-5-phosphate phosphoketolase @ Fructose-6-phosphate phosphoketolase n=1 Tax=Nonomuraea gerenzanensis TaxID=93944 RepID=A0A1M4E4N3_9ACTN|nr:phosphoketolase family protein [Nonomuraea gerenzanensis]UBU16023.1 phosphoketolase family protein [Nonomuraea gerenzanensis]SBO93825.1 Xylulose-5-phosphate phosphoketolase @ Fructose-6-phosphate phosphoketolase [Nonomuraea gerenzanensis]
MYGFDVTISSAVSAREQRRKATAGPLSPELLDRMQRYWQAANYVTVAQIYLQDNPLLREPLRHEHVKPRLLGHWGTSPGLNLIYLHLNRLITERDADVIYLAGPGHGGPALVGQAYLEGTYSEFYPAVTPDTAGLRLLCRRFSTPDGVPSHVSVPTPGSVHEGGELGYVLSHAFGAAFDNPDLIVAAVVGDGEAESGPLAGAWRSTAFLNPARDGAVLPILHLNGYKISGPAVISRDSDADIEAFLRGNGYQAHFVEGDDPPGVHQELAAALDRCHEQIRAIQREARNHGVFDRPRWPAIVLRTPKGWTGPKEVDGLPAEGTFRSHQVPMSDTRTNSAHLAQLEEWLRSYRPEELFDAEGRLVPELAALAPAGERRMSANPHANGGKVLIDLDIPDFRDYAIKVEQPAVIRRESPRQLGMMLRDIYTRNAEAANFRLFCPDETNSNRLGNVFEVENRCFVGRTLDIDDHLSPDGRVMEVLSEHLCEGWLEGYTLTGRHGIFATYEAFAMVSASMAVQHAKWLQEARNVPWREPVPSLNILLTSTCWRNDHNGFSHQGPGLIDVMLSKRGTVTRIYLPPDANCLLSVGDHCLRSRDYVNLIVIDKQPQLQFLDMETAIRHCENGVSIWHKASNDEGGEPDVVLGCAGDIPTMETVAAAWYLRRIVPDLRVRVVNVVDLMRLFPVEHHPHGTTDKEFVELFTEDKPVVFAFHGYRRAIHEIVHGHPHVGRIHVRGFSEQGTTTTPFQMVVLNEMSRFHLAAEAIRRVPRLRERAADLVAQCEARVAEANAYAREHFEDQPEIRDWVWTDHD